MMSLTAPESQSTSTANALREMMALAERLAIQLEETSGSEYRLRLARACALALCDTLHEIETSR
jgi:ABC-type cobalamin transport system ATPase subunit